MKYQINDRVLVSDHINKFAGTVVTVHGRLCRVNYDLGGYVWIEMSKLEPLVGLCPKGYRRVLA